MGRKSLFALLAFATFATAAVVGMGASVAFAGESTGNCGNAATDPAGRAPGGRRGHQRDGIPLQRRRRLAEVRGPGQ